MPLQKLPTTGLDDINHRRRARETLNNILDHTFDDSRVRTPAEVAADVTPVNPAYAPGDVRRLGWSESNTGAQNAAVLESAAAVWVAGGPSISIPEGTFQLESFEVPSGRGLIIRGQGPTKTKLVHSTSGAMFTLGADNIQEFSLRDLYIEPSASSTVVLDWSGDFQAYYFEFWNVEINEASSGNNSVVCFQIVGGSTPGSHEKHYFKWFGGKIFGCGTGFKLDGSSAAANDFTAVGFHIQGCEDDGILLDDSSGNRFIGSVENCGDGTTNYNLRIVGTSSGDNEFVGRLENTISPTNQVLSIATNVDTNNRIYSTLSATPTPANDLCISGGLVMHNGLEFTNIERRRKGLERILGAATTDYLQRFMLSTDTMSSFGRFGIRADGRLSWATGSNPSDWDVHLERLGTGALMAFGSINNRVQNKGTVSSGTIDVACQNGLNIRAVLGSDVTVNAPTNPPDGGFLSFHFVQDATGGRTVTFNSTYKRAGGAYTMTAAANAIDTITFRYSTDSGHWVELCRAQNLS